MLVTTAAPILTHAQNIGALAIAGRKPAAIISGGAATVVWNGVDDKTQGLWLGTYGSDGFRIFADRGAETSDPSYAAVTVTGATYFTTTDGGQDMDGGGGRIHVSDYRALQHSPDGPECVDTGCYSAAFDNTEMIISSAYSATSFTIDIEPTDADPHQVAFYMTDWNLDGRTTQIDMKDADTSMVLDSQTTTDVRFGQYFIWTFTGHITVEFSAQDAVYGTDYAVASGMFFDPSPTSTTVSLTSPTASTRGPAEHLELKASYRPLSGRYIDHVDFRTGSTTICTFTPDSDTISLAHCTWSGMSQATHSLTARTTDNMGSTVTSSAVSVVINSSADPAGLPVGVTSLPLITVADLTYQGGFKVPTGVIGTSFSGYGGSQIAFRPDNGHLLMSGTTDQGNVLEMTIPALSTGAIGTYNRASPVQGYWDTTEGQQNIIREADTEVVQLGGILVWGSDLFTSYFVTYDSAGTVSLSHFRGSLTAATTGEVKYGGFGAGAGGAVGGYMGVIPTAWQTALGGTAFTGLCCQAILSRTSTGPSFFSWDPDTFTGTSPITVASSKLLYFDLYHDMGLRSPGYGAMSRMYNQTDAILGMALLAGTRTLMVVGSHGDGKYCYSEADECISGPYPSGDIAHTSKGPHSPPYRYFVWMFDLVDLAAVKSGLRSYGSLLPYDYAAVSVPFDPGASDTFGGIGYDAANKTLYLGQLRPFQDGDNPLIQVYTHP